MFVGEHSGKIVIGHFSEFREPSLTTSNRQNEELSSLCVKVLFRSNTWRSGGHARDRALFLAVEYVLG